MEYNVLVVDDSAAIRKIVLRVLKRAGMPIHSVYEAADGREAIEILKSHPIALILTDINMPNMDGLQLLAAVKSSDEWRSIPVVIISIDGGEPKVSAAARLGAVAYLRKPFTADQIQEKLTAILEPGITY